MAKKKLVVVESPGKIKKIGSFLGPEYIIRASMGHIMDLPQKGLGIDVKKDFEPEYAVIPKKKETVADLKKVSKDVDEVYLASDNDREGSWISESVRRVLERKGLVFHRIVFNSITKKEILDAVANPSVIDTNLVEAQQARRILDRLMGFKISPLLWRHEKSKEEKSRSAGRVQSVGLRMIVDRQKEIDAFKAVKYWTIEVTLSDGKEEFVVQVVQKDKLSISSAEMAEKIVKILEEQEFIVESVDKSQEKKNPPAPFTTSTLQQVGSGALSWKGDRTMEVAQKLYEGGHCLHPKTLVTTADGVVHTIEEVVNNKLSAIVGVDNEGKAAVLEVTNYSVREAPATLYRITTSKNHSIIVTGDHPLLKLQSTQGQQWVKASELRVGDYLGSQERIVIQNQKSTIFDLLEHLPLDRQDQVLVLLHDDAPSSDLKEWIKKEKLAESTIYKYQRNKTLTLKTYLEIRRLYKAIDNYYKGLQYRSARSEAIYPELYITPQLSRWIGLVLGDGSIGLNSVTVRKPDITPEIYSQYYREAFGDGVVRKSGKTSMISKLFMEALGYTHGKKSKVLFIPEFIMRLEDHCIEGFVSGCWDADGSIKKSPQANGCKVSISSGSKKFIDSMRLLLLRLGVVASYHTEKQEKINAWRSIINGQTLVARSDQHYLYINSGSWNAFYRSVRSYLINRLSQLEIVNRSMETRLYKRDKQSRVPINDYIELIRSQSGTTKQELGQKLEIDYWNYYGKVHGQGRTRLSYFNKEQVRRIGEILSNELMLELGSNDIYWEDIKNIEVLNNSDKKHCREVYDLTTSQHNFTCNGFITHNCSYMRTDSVTIAQEAIDGLRTLIPTITGPKYLPSAANVYQNKSKNAQNAHEAIRVTHFDDLPQILMGIHDLDEKKLGELIWRRTVASQMTPAVYDKVEVVVKAGKVALKASGQTQVFDGYLKVWTHTDTKELALPDLKVGQKLTKIKIESVEHETKPPARYTDASLVKELESNGVGRPSTYATVAKTLLARGYVKVSGKAYEPTPKGVEVSDFLKEHFSNLINVSFTAQMETELDEVAEGQKTRLELLRKFYKELSDTIEVVKTKFATNEVSAEACPICKAQMFVKLNRKDNQRFLACSNKDCKKTFNMDENEKPVERKVEKLDKPCPECGGDLLKRTGKNGIFFGCENYKEKGCKVTASADGTIKVPPKNTGKKCKKCKRGTMLERKNRTTGEVFLGCSNYPKCKNAESL
jgi:DNA topoisomerase IA/intein/homing endonuclease